MQGKESFRKMLQIKKVHEVGQKDDRESDVEYLLSVQKKIFYSVDDNGPIYVKMNVRDYGKVKSQVDCGATVNVIPQNLLTLISYHSLIPVYKCIIIRQ